MIDEVMFEIREMTGQEYRNHYAGESPDTAAEPPSSPGRARVTDPVPEEPAERELVGAGALSRSVLPDRPVRADPDRTDPDKLRR